jgi:hypothetical protein
VRARSELPLFLLEKLKVWGEASYFLLVKGDHVPVPALPIALKWWGGDRTEVVEGDRPSLKIKTNGKEMTEFKRITVRSRSESLLFVLEKLAG